MAKPKSNKRYYFTEETEDKIVEYVNETNQEIRNKIYREFIERSFSKLVENVIHTYKFYYYEVSYEDTKHETIAHLIDKLNNYNKGSGKAFSYFTIVARNHLITLNDKAYKAMKRKVDLSLIDEERNVINEIDYASYKSTLKIFFNLYIEYCEANLAEMFTKKRDIQIAASILALFKRREYLENFNKKALYIMIREATDASTHEVTKIVTVLKKKFIELSKSYAQNSMVKQAC